MWHRMVGTYPGMTKTFSAKLKSPVDSFVNEPERTDEDDVDKIYAIALQQFESTSASNERFEKPTSSADVRDIIRSGIQDPEDYLVGTGGMEGVGCLPSRQPA